MVLSLGGPAWAQQKGKESARQTQADDRAAFEEMATTFTRAWNTRNMDLMDPYFADDVVQVNPFGQEAVGEESVEALITADLRAIDDDQTRFSVERVRKVAPDVALVDMRHQYSEAPAPNLPDHAQMTALAIRKGGKWQIQDIRVGLPLPRPEAVGGSGAQ
jgi:uncharacterized protein (TIGR02246 family)